MKATTENIDRLFSFIKEQHESNNERGEFDDEMDLKDVLDSAQEHLKEAEPEPTYILLEDAIHIVGSHKVSLNEKIRQEEMHEYSIVEREEVISNLIGWIGESNKDSGVMRDDMEMLLGWNDYHILTSNSTNSYLRQGDSEFDDACKELLEINESL